MKPNKKRSMENAMAELDRILSFTELPGDKQKAQARERAEKNKRVVQGGLSNCKNTERLIRILNFGVSDK